MFYKNTGGVAMTVESNWCTLKVDTAGMYALMSLRAPSGDEEIAITEPFIIAFLNDQKIISGINSIAIQAMLENVQYGQFVCVAQGAKPLRGPDGYFEYQKDMQDMKKKPIINDDGTADYKNSLSLATINEGELLAIYIPAKEGTPGKDVYGFTLPSPGKGKDIPPLRGKGIVADDSKQKFYAEYSGHIVMEGSKICIDKLYRVNGDLDIETGNIVFDGDVEVMGDVRSGINITSKGSIFIHGHVGACQLDALANITIEKGIQGRDSCTITAGEDITCKFIERAKLIADGNIYADSVLYSNLTAKNKIFITSKHGNVISSEVYGMCGVTIKEAGNSAGAPTLLRAGLPREDYARASELTRLIKEIDVKTDSFNTHLSSLENHNASGDLSADKMADLRTQIMRAKIVLSSQKKEYSDELSELTERINADSDNSHINITGTVFEGVRIYIGIYPYLVGESIKEVSFAIRNGEVLAVPLT